jgi:hypothetical protein
VSDHHPEHRPDDAVAPRPTPAPPAPAPRATVGGTPVRGPVATIGIVALLAVIAVIVWGGGDRGTLATGGPGGPTDGGDRGASVATGDGIEGGQSGPVATERPGEATGEPTGERPTFEAAPIDPAQIAPTPLRAADPVIRGAGYEWLLSGRVDAVTEQFLGTFPQPGYEMKGGLGADHPSGQTLYVYTVTPTDDPSSAPVATMYFLADPADPQGQTRVGLKIGR